MSHKVFSAYITLLENEATCQIFIEDASKLLGSIVLYTANRRYEWKYLMCVSADVVQRALMHDHGEEWDGKQEIINDALSIAPALLARVADPQLAVKQPSALSSSHFGAASVNALDGVYLGEEPSAYAPREFTVTVGTMSLPLNLGLAQAQAALRRLRGSG